MLPSSCVSKQVCTRLLPFSRGPAIRPCVLRRPICKLRAHNSRGRDLPKSWNQVMEWACKEFQREVDIAKPDENISIAKALMLLALEEEAALEVHPEMMEVLQSLPGLKLQSHASASTWSLERLDALTAEIKDLVMTSVGEWEQQASASAAELAHARNAGAGFASHRCEASDSSAARAGASGAAKDAATNTYSASVTNTSNDSTCDGESGAAQVDSGDTVSVRTGANSSNASDSSSHGTSKGGEDAGAISSCAQASSSSNASTNAGACSEGREEEMALTKGRGFYKGYRPKGIAGSFLPERRGKKRDAAGVAVEEGGTQAGKIGSSTIGAPQNLGGNRATDAPGNLNVHGTTAAPQNLSGSGATAAPSAPPDFLQLPSGLFKAFPGQVVSAINEVLYVRHGYAPCNRWGNIRWPEDWLCTSHNPIM
ncbi:hypothetical protein DUNSADRAFT_14614 [Dunaliella salina]|uniref:Uncharacterized protein n=1 Tax=Dunaliella salina TaxID=3046 RepID=A0ABQ7H2G7_DUNSA|nr:hypothetical protein DUNSADRAFT_14614 [Dunaliella salina]|eukprot:KAF5841056.1 hypothetical protein DUNSADRAFT_14614 [Dunaliella salina]